MKIIAKIVVSISILVLAFVLLDYAYAFGIKNNRNLKSSYISLKPKNSNILIHGPCEPLWMIDPQQIDSLTQRTSYNLALSHSDFADNYLHFYLYLKNNKPPEYLMLYVTPESLDKKFNTFNTYRFTAFLDDDTIAETVREMDPDYYKWTSIPFMRFAYYNNRIMFDVLQGYKHYQNDRTEAYYPSGFEPPAKIVWDNHLEDMKKQYPQGYTFKADPIRIKYLEKIIMLANKNSVRVILYESPVLQESMASVTNRNEMIQLIKKIAIANNAEYKQFDNLPLSSSREFFISSLNLNMKGLRIFNDTLASFISKLP